MRLKNWSASCALAALAFTAIAPPAHAVAVEATCGAVLTTDAYLTSDLVCTGAGVTLDADVTLDLGGHKLTGTAKQTAITVTNGHSVTVKSGQVSGWAYGLRIGGAWAPDTLGTISVDNVTFSGNIYGVNGQDSQQNIAGFVITGSRFTGNRDGFHGDFTAPLKVSTSSFARNQTAIYVDSGSSVAVTDSLMESNVTGLRCFATVCKASRSTLRKNSFGATSGDYGNVELTDSTVTGNDIGYTAGYGLLKSNTFSNNNTGVVVIESGSVQATNNLFTGNGVGVTSVVTEGYTPRAELTGNTFLRNVDGVNVTLNSDDSDSQALLQGNIAVGNKRYGIHAPGATDAGENKATKNGKSCVGVQCAEDVNWPRCTTSDHHVRSAAAPPLCIPDHPGIPWRAQKRIGRTAR